MENKLSSLEQRIDSLLSYFEGGKATEAGSEAAAKANHGGGARGT